MPKTKGASLGTRLRLIPPTPARPRARADARGAARGRLAAAPGRGAGRAAEADTGAGRGGARAAPRAVPEERSGIVLETSRRVGVPRSAPASAACARLFEKPAERGLSQAALETLAIVAYLGPCRARRSRASAASTSTASSPVSSNAGWSPKAAAKRVRRDPLPHDTALRAHLRARVARRAAARRRPRRRRGRDPRAARGRREKRPA